MDEVLTPEKIYQYFIENKLNKNEALQKLILLIENSNNTEVRIKCIEALEKFKTEDIKIFKIFENFMVSDEDEEVRIASVKALIKSFPNKCIDPILWEIERNKSAIMLIEIFNLISSLESEIFEKTKGILIDKFWIGAQKFINKGVNIDDALILYMMELYISGLKFYRYKKERTWREHKNFALYYKTNKEGHIEKVTRGTTYGQFLRGFPNQICALKHLKELELPWFGIKNVPKSISYLKNLKILDLSVNLIQEFPKSIFSLKSLKTLNLSENSIQKLPISIEKLQSLEILYLSNNKIQNIPQSITSLKNLKSIKISHNKLKDIPMTIYSFLRKFIANKYLNDGVNPNDAIVLGLLEIIVGRELTNIDLLMEEIRSHRDYDYSNFTDILDYENPRWMFFEESHSMLHYRLNDNGRVIGIYIYYFENPLLGFFPEQICDLECLEDLFLPNNEISIIPYSIGNLKSLKYINLAYNKIEEIPDSMSNFNKLESFDVMDNNLKFIPRQINDIIKLTQLRLKGRSFFLKFQKEYDKALKIFEKSLEIKPDSSLTWYFFAEVFFKKKQYNKSIDACEKCLELDPTLIEAKILLRTVRQAFFYFHLKIKIL